MNELYVAIVVFFFVIGGLLGYVIGYADGHTHQDKKKK